MTDVTNRASSPCPGTIGITIEVIAYNRATGTYRTLKSVAYPPFDPAAAKKSRGKGGSPAA